MLVLSQTSLALVLVLAAPTPDPAQELPTPSRNAPSDDLLGAPPVDPLNPSSAPLPEPEPEPPTPGIEFAVPPPEDEPAPAEGPRAPAEQQDIDARWPDPGTAPSDGNGAFVSAAILAPSAALMTYLLVRPPIRGDADDISTIVVGSAMGGLALGLVGMGISRKLKLRKWAIAYRVRPTFQGGGMLAAGGLALNYGLALTLAGAFGSGLQYRWPLLIAGLGSLGVLAPPLLIFGKRTRERYLRTGGWYRPPLPPIPVSMSVQPLRGGVGIGFSGRF